MLPVVKVWTQAGLRGHAVLLKVMGGGRGAQTTTGDGELVDEEATAEEVLLPEAIAVNSSLERVLDVAAETMALHVGSDGNGGVVVALAREHWRPGESRAEVKMGQFSRERR
jgi:hypothetical protein